MKGEVLVVVLLPPFESGSLMLADTDGVLRVRQANARVMLAQDGRYLHVGIRWSSLRGGWGGRWSIARPQCSRSSLREAPKGCSARAVEVLLVLRSFTRKNRGGGSG